MRLNVQTDTCSERLQEMPNTLVTVVFVVFVFFKMTVKFAWPSYFGKKTKEKNSR